MQCWLKRKKVLLIDADPQGNATSGIGVERGQEVSVYEVLTTEMSMRDTIQETHVKI